MRKENFKRLFSTVLMTGILLQGGQSNAAELKMIRTYYKSGALKAELPYREGRLEGDAKWYYENGALGALMNYRDSRLNGEARIFYENGNLKRIMQLQQNTPVGEARIYSSDGSLNIVDFHDHGKILSRWRYGPEGHPMVCEEISGAAAPPEKLIQF